MGSDLRIDKWLWAARFFKTRGLAQAAIESGRVLVDGQRVKLSRPLRVGDRLQVRAGDLERTVIVEGLSDQRGPAQVAQQLYRETEESIAKREAHAQQRRLAAEPALSIEAGRPTKRDRRALERLRSSLR